MTASPPQLMNMVSHISTLATLDFNCTRLTWRGWITGVFFFLLRMRWHHFYGNHQMCTWLLFNVWNCHKKQQSAAIRFLNYPGLFNCCGQNWRSLTLPALDFDRRNQSRWLWRWSMFTCRAHGWKEEKPRRRTEGGTGADSEIAQFCVIILLLINKSHVKRCHSP